MLRAGLDWASASHAFCVVDGEGQRVLQGAVPHTADGLAGMLRRLARLAPSSQIPIAIERPTGLIVDALVHAGHPVVPIHPNVLKATRSRYSAARGKSDPVDAYILADLLRTDGHRFRTLEPLSDPVRALRALVRSRDDLVAQRSALSNQLTALLESFWPGAATLFASINSPISLAFLKRYPSPSAAKRLGPLRMANFLQRHRYPGRQRADKLLARLRAAPIGLAGDLEEAVKAELVQAWVDILSSLVEQLGDLTARIEHLVAQLPAGQVLMSFPRAGKLNAAQILAELGTDSARFPTEERGGRRRAGDLYLRTASRRRLSHRL